MGVVGSNLPFKRIIPAALQRTDYLRAVERQLGDNRLDQTKVKAEGVGSDWIQDNFFQIRDMITCTEFREEDKSKIFPSFLNLIAQILF